MKDWGGIMSFWRLRGMLGRSQKETSRDAMRSRRFFSVATESESTTIMFATSQRGTTSLWKKFAQILPCSLCNSLETRWDCKTIHNRTDSNWVSKRASKWFKVISCRFVCFCFAVIYWNAIVNKNILLL